MDHTEKLEMTEPKTFREASRILVGLTHDDILTLKLLRDDEEASYQRWPDEKHRRLQDMKLLETLERILKQVG